MCTQHCNRKPLSPPSRPPIRTAAEATTYKIDPDHTSVAFKIRHLVTTVTGRFEKFEGKLKDTGGNLLRAAGIEVSLNFGNSFETFRWPLQEGLPVEAPLEEACQGLQAYVPSVLPPSDHPQVPDEIALVFYPSRQCYRQASHASVAGRAYGALHGTVFSFQARQGRPASHSDFPASFADRPEQSGPVQLFDSGGCWQQGEVFSEVWLRRGQGVAAFRQGVCEAMRNLRARPRQGLLGVYYYRDDELFVTWSHWQRQGQVL